ncbi:hypothetical protein ABDC18_002861 [Escherichia coli]
MNKRTLSPLITIFAKGDLSYERIAYIANSLNGTKLTAQDVHTFFTRYHRLYGKEEYVFPFLTITPNQALDIEVMLDKVSDALVHEKYNISSIDMMKIKHGAFSFPIDISNARLTPPTDEHIEAHKKLIAHENRNNRIITPHKKDVVTIGNEKFDVSGLSDIGKKQIKSIINGTATPKKFVRIENPTLLERLQSSYDWDDWEDFINARKSKDGYTFEKFCNVKSVVVYLLSTIGMPRPYDRDVSLSYDGTARRASLTDGEVRVLRELHRRELPKIYLNFFYSFIDPSTILNIVNNNSYCHIK